VPRMETFVLIHATRVPARVIEFAIRRCFHYCTNEILRKIFMQ